MDNESKIRTWESIHDGLAKNETAHILAGAFETFGERIALSSAFGPSGIVLMHLASQVRAHVFFIVTQVFILEKLLEMIDRIHTDST